MIVDDSSGRLNYHRLSCTVSNQGLLRHYIARGFKQQAENKQITHENALNTNIKFPLHRVARSGGTVRNNKRFWNWANL